jgi:site-specific DNA-cytosine methylase
MSRVLVACEFSGIVRDAFIAAGHDAMSCDLLPSERLGPHIEGDVRKVLGDGWDLMVAHPPCTYLSRAGARWWKEPGRREQAEEAAAFVQARSPRDRSRTFVGIANAMAKQWGAVLDQRVAA